MRTVKQSKSPAWPVLKRYEGDQLARVSLPLGGIGTGTVGLGGRGQLRDWELMNRPSKGFVPKHAFFALYAKTAGGVAVARALEGAILPQEFEGATGSPAANHGLPRFRKCVFETAYPFAQVSLADPEVPVDVRLEAFNPLVPADAEASGIPMAVLRFVLKNKTAKRVEAAVCGNIENFIGSDGKNGKPLKNRNTFRSGPGAWKGIYMHSEGVAAEDEFGGTLALATDAEQVTWRTAWPQLSWGNTLLDFWDDFSDDGRLDQRQAPGLDAPTASLAAKVVIEPHATQTVTFLLTWRFPNRMTWTPDTSLNPVGGATLARTPFVRTAEVSRLLPADPALAAWDYPADQSSLGFAPRTFGTDFCSVRPDIEREGKDDRCILYRYRIACPEAMRLDLLLGYDGPVRVWIDGRLRYHDPAGKNPAAADSVRVGFDATAGEHEIMLALGTNGGLAWGLFMRFERTDLPLSTLQGGAKPVLPTVPGATPVAAGCGCADGTCRTAPTNRVGNYYATCYADAWEVIAKTAKGLPKLEARTLEFVRAFVASDLPEAVKEAALFNLSTLRSQTCFRIDSGEFLAWEGCCDGAGCCYGSCTHVWNYETATAFLFGGLTQTMREVEFLHATRDNGLMSFRVNLPLARAAEHGMAAADGQLGCIIKAYRDWQLCGDDAWLGKLWPKVKKTLEFCWIPGGWDADADGVMEGCQHNTMDVEYYGPNPQMEFWYLGALRAAEEMARHLGEVDFADRCRELFARGSAWTDTNLFNGEYYEHEIRPPKSADAIAPGLRVGMGSGNLAEPILQLGSGCLVDQLVGQYLAHVCGLGYLADPAKIGQTLRSIMKYNFKENLYGHFNHLRTFALNDEAALLMASYPLGRRPAQPFPYYNEVMTGFEYTAATHMLYEGQTANGLKAIAAIRARYDGRRRNPFDEAECGHHYGRAMASWTAVLALTGFHYSGVTRTLTFAANPGRHFWSNGHAWGTCDIRTNQPGQWTATLEVLEGRLKVKTFRLAGVGETVTEKAGLTVKPGTPAVFAPAGPRPGRPKKATR